MNREILFRGQRVDNKELVYGYVFPVVINEVLRYFIIPCDTYCPKHITIKELQVEVIPKTIGQFTGLTDKNGVKIFEGDVLKSNMYNKKWIVDFTPCDGLKLAIKYEDDFKINGIFQTHEDWSYNKISSCEIIGNIHE